MSRIAFSALSFFLVIIVPLAGNDEPKVSLIQTPGLVRLLLTAHTRINPKAGPTVYENGLWYTEAGDSIRFVAGERYADNGVFVAK